MENSTPKTKMSWDEIAAKYPDQWVGLTDVERKPNNRSTIKAAVVAYADKSKNELLHMQLDGKIETSRYTTPNNIFSMGALLHSDCLFISVNSGGSPQ